MTSPTDYGDGDFLSWLNGFGAIDYASSLDGFYDA
jgi:hypothetical protein